MSNGPLFDYRRSEAAKRDGIAQVGENSERWVDRARDEARLICKGENHTGPFTYYRGEVHSDQVRYRMETEIGWGPKHFNAYGGVFGLASEWIFTGRRHQSTVVKNHRNWQRIWRHVGGLTPEREDLPHD